MYLNGPPIKNISRSGSINNNSESHRGGHLKEKHNSIGAKVTNKLIDIQLEFKDDMNKHVARLLKATRQTSPVENLAAKKAANNKLQKDCLTRKNNLSLYGRSGNLRAARLDSQSGQRLKAQRSLVEVQADWKTIKTSLKRSISQSSARQRDSNHLTRGDYHTNRLEMLKISRISDTTTRLLSRNDIAFKLTRCGSWLSNLHIHSPLATSLFILINILLIDQIVLSAPIGISRPLWLDDGQLVDVLSQNAIDKSDNAILRFDDSPLGLKLAGFSSDNIKRSSSLEYPNTAEETYLGQGDVGDLESGLQLAKSIPSNGASLLVEPTNTGQLSHRLERRRLERERALEPAPWMREQPMRRGFNNPISPVNEQVEIEKVQRESNHDDNDDDADKSMPDQDSLNIEEDGSEARDDVMLQTNAPTYSPVLGRRSRQLNHHVYEEILRHLFDEALESRAFLDALYDELELKTKSNNLRPIAGSSMLLQPSIVGDGGGGGGGAGAGAGSGSNQQQQEGVASDGNNAASGQDLSLDTNSDSTLVVAGDEVSSNDDPAPSMTGGGGSMKGSPMPAMNAAYTQDLPGINYAALQADASKAASNDGIAEIMGSESLPLLKLIVEESSANNASSAPNVRANSSSTDQALYIVPMIGSLVHKPDVDSPKISINLDGDQQQRRPDFIVQPDLQRVPPIISPSFHVIEDIDQTDQDSAMPIPTTGDQDDQQQFIEQTELLTKDGESLTKSLSHLTKRNAAATWMRQAQTIESQPSADEQQTIPADSKESLSGIERKMPDRDASMSSTLGLLDSGYLSKGQLSDLAGKFKRDLEDAIGLSRSTIESFYPVDSEKLLIKIDTKKLSIKDMINMYQNYGK